MGKVEENNPKQQRKRPDDFPLCIGKILNECQQSYALHPRRIKELVVIRRDHKNEFMKEWWQTLRPVFLVMKREPAVERIVRFVAAFAAYRDERHGDECDAFLEEFFGILLYTSDASNKAVRFRACQILSEVIMRLPDNAEVSNEVWDEVIDCMQRRMQDKVPIIRVYAVRALARFANDIENVNIVDLYKEALVSEQNAEVRKMLVLSIPPSNATALDIIERTLDVNDSVRKAAYRVLANKFPLQSLSIKLRTTILRRGLADRVPAVTTECIKMMKDAWLAKCCEGDPIALLKYLDVETNESVGEAVMEELLKAGVVQIKDGQSLREFFIAENEANNDNCSQKVKLMDAETALYWRMLCRHLHWEAQEKGSDAASTQGAEAVVYAAAAADKNELLDRVLPSTVAEYVQLVEAHLLAGSNYRFVSRQLVLLGLMLDFSDAASRKVASSLLQKLLYKPIEHAIDEEDGKEVVIGDGINLGGDKEWARAVTELARKVHASSGEFEDIVATVVADLGRPCREGGADFLQWMHCLAVTGLVLEGSKSLRGLQGRAIEASEILHGLLLPAAKHIHVEVRRAATRCLGVYGLREKKPSEQVVRHLRLAFCNGPSPVRIMSAKALFDLCMWHGAAVVDRAIGVGAGLGTIPQPRDFVSEVSSTTTPGEVIDGDEGDSGLMTLDLLSSGLDRDDWNEDGVMGDTETTWGVLAEGFAKLLLQSKRYPDILSMQSSLFAKLICLYFNEETKELHRLRQCLSVFFDQYPALSAEHKKCISKAFIPVMRSVWPGVYGNAGGSSTIMVSALRKNASQISRFMLQLLQTPLYNAEDESSGVETGQHSPNEEGGQEIFVSKQTRPEVDAGLEELAIRIGVEVASFPSKKTAAGKSYLAALCRVAVLLDFRSSEQEAIKCMRKLLNHMAESISGDKQVVKDLEGMMARMKAIDAHPNEGLPDEQIKLILGNLGLDSGIDIESIVEDSVCTPAPKRAATRRRAKRVETPDSSSPVSLQPVTPCTTRAQRVSKTAALGKMSKKQLDLEITDEIDEEELKFISKTSSSEEDLDSTDTEYVAERDEVEETTGKKGSTRLTQAENLSDDNQSQNENDDGNLPKPMAHKKKSFKSKENPSVLRTTKKPSRSVPVAYEEEEDSDFEVSCQKTQERSAYISTRKTTVKSTKKAQSKKQSENLVRIINSNSVDDSEDEESS
jgi:condensin complex subunit 3